MQVDIVIPNQNEKDFIEFAKKMGYSALIFAYPDTSNPRPNTLSQEFGSFRFKIAALINSENKEKIRTISNFGLTKNLITLVKSKGGIFDRFILEKTGATGLFDAETVNPKDHLHFRRSGLDQISSKLASIHKKIIVVQLNKLISGGANQTLVLGRIMQNIKFSNKYGFFYLLASFAREPREMRGAADVGALAAALGMKSRKRGAEIFKSLFASNPKP